MKYLRLNGVEYFQEGRGTGSTERWGFAGVVYLAHGHYKIVRRTDDNAATFVRFGERGDDYVYVVETPEEIFRLIGAEVTA